MKVSSNPQNPRRRTQSSTQVAAPPLTSRFAHLLRGKKRRTLSQARGRSTPSDSSPKRTTPMHVQPRDRPPIAESPARKSAHDEQECESDARDPSRERLSEPKHTPAYLDAEGAIMPALLPPLGGPPPAAPAAGTGAERAQAAALAERLLRSMHVGEISGGHEVRMRLAGGDIEVQLQEVDGVLKPTLIGAGDLGPLARRLEIELQRRGLRFDRIELSS